MANPSPKITFEVNLETLNRQGHAVPSRTQTSGNETVAEADQFKNTRSTWLASMFPGVEHIAKADGAQIVAYGSKATYLKRTYATGLPDAILTVVSIEDPE